MPRCAYEVLLPKIQLASTSSRQKEGTVEVGMRKLLSAWRHWGAVPDRFLDGLEATLFSNTHDAKRERAALVSASQPQFLSFPRVDDEVSRAWGRLRLSENLEAQNNVRKEM